jgi:iron complex outermembrane recepter protein
MGFSGWLCGLVLVLSWGMTTSPVHAADDTSEVLQEVTVTAQKREQSLQTVGTSITALDSAAINKLGLSDVTSIAGQTPGMQFNQYGATVTVYNLRGVSQNDFSDHQEAPIAVYADDAYIASMGALAGSLFDIQRVEVLRGPQGTLFGRNATGGLIHYISEKPKFDSDGNVSVTGGNFGTINSEGALNLPLNDQFAARLSFATDHHDGYVTNRIGPAINDEKQYAARLQLLYKPNEQGEILLKLYGMANDNEVAGNYSWAASHPDATGRGVLITPTSTANCPNLDGGCTPGGDLLGYRNPSNDPFNQAEDRRGIFNRTVGGGTVHVTWNFDQFTLASVTDYLRLQKRYGEDSDISPLPAFVYDTFQHYHQLSEEVRLNGSSGDLKWITGLYFLDYHTRNNADVGLLAALGGPSAAAFTLTTRSESAFGQLEYDFAPAFTGIVGARYSSDQKTFDYLYTNDPQIPVVYNKSTDPGADRTFGNITAKAELDYKFAPGSMAYASVNRGAKGGGWSAPVSGVIDPNALPYKQETLTSYEMGQKSTFWDGRARVNSAVFYYDYRNYQGFFLQGLTQVVQNVDATVKGAELEFALAPVHGMNLQLGMSHLETRAKNVPLPAGGFTDTEMPQAPKWSINAVARYEWTIPTGHLAVEADTKWNAHQYLELLNASADYVGSYPVSNARLTYTSTDAAWEFALWGKNLADRNYPVYGLDLSSLGFQQFVYGPPRTYGATFTYRWGP